MLPVSTPGNVSPPAAVARDRDAEKTRDLVKAAGSEALLILCGAGQKAFCEDAIDYASIKGAVLAFVRAMSGTLATKACR